MWRRCCPRHMPGEPGRHASSEDAATGLWLLQWLRFRSDGMGQLGRGLFTLVVANGEVVDAKLSPATCALVLISILHPTSKLRRYGRSRWFECLRCVSTRCTSSCRWRRLYLAAPTHVLAVGASRNLATSPSISFGGVVVWCDTEYTPLPLRTPQSTTKQRGVPGAVDIRYKCEVETKGRPWDCLSRKSMPFAFAGCSVLCELE